MDMDPRYEHLISSLERSGYLKTAEIASAMRATDRNDFLPEAEKVHAYDDKPIAIGWDQVSSQPLVVAFMLELLAPRKGDRILDIGTGIGWQAAILSRIVGESGRIVTIERHPDLHAFAENNFSDMDMFKSGVIENISGDASVDLKSDLVFDRMISGAEVDEVPALWKNLLVVGGRMVIPVKGSIVVADKMSVDTFNTKEYVGFGFTPLITGKKK